MSSADHEEEDPFAGYLSPFAPPKPANGSRRLSAADWEEGPFTSELLVESEGETPADELEQDELEDESEVESYDEVEGEELEREEQEDTELEYSELEEAELEDPESGDEAYVYQPIGWPTTPAPKPGPPSPGADPSVAPAPFTYKKRLWLPAPLLTPAKNASACQWNRQQHPSVSGVNPAHIRTDVARYVDLKAVAEAIRKYNKAHPSAPIRPGTPPIDAVFVEAIHQFQAKCFLDKRRIDGLAGESTLDSLGLVERSGMHSVDRVNPTAQGFLNRVDVAGMTKNEFTAQNWFKHMVNPTFLGWQFVSAGEQTGVHRFFMRKLRVAENVLLAMSKYRGMTPVELGRALGVNEVNRGARPTRPDASMHGYGLAVDINYIANPWVRCTEFYEALKRSALLMSGVKITQDRSQVFLHSLGSDPRMATGRIYDILVQRNRDFRNYLKLDGEMAALRAALERRRAAGTAGVFEPANETTDQAAGRWMNHITKDLANMRDRWCEGKDKSEVAPFTQNRDPLKGFLSLNRDLVLVLRDKVGLAWGAVDFGGNTGNGDMMHFDDRICGLGNALAAEIRTNRGRTFIPKTGHPHIGCGRPVAGRTVKETETAAEDFSSPFALGESGNDSEYDSETDELEGTDGESDVLAEDELEEAEAFEEEEFEEGEAFEEALELQPESFTSEYEDPVLESYAAESLADEQSLVEEAGVYEAETEYEAARRSNAFPSGATLPVVGGPSASEKDEYWDPNGTGNPLLDTSATQAGVRLSANFTVGELARSGSHRFEKARIDPRLIQCLEAIRNRVGKPVLVNSGYRSWGYNQQLYRGLKQKPSPSRHCSGQAADIRVAGMSGLDVAKAAIDAWGGNIAVGVDRNYAHVDVRGQWAGWTYPGLGNAAARKRALDEIEAYRRARAARPQPRPSGTTPQPSPAPSPVPAPLASAGRVPAGFKLVKRKDRRGNEREAGLARYGGGRVDEALLSLRQSKLISITDDEIDTLQRIANVESSGLLLCLNTWDSAVVSLGFMQLTLQWGGMQEWIARAPAAFARYGIALDPSTTYSWGANNRQTAIRGVANKEELRWNGWAQRFYDAGADEAVLVAQVAVVREKLQDQLKRLKLSLKNVPGAYDRLMEHYRRSAYLRGVLHEGYNNRPTPTKKAVARTLAQAPAGTTTERFFEIFQRELLAQFGAEAEKARRIISKTASGARFGKTTAASPAATPSATSPAPLPLSPSAPARPPSGAAPVADMAPFATRSPLGLRTSGGRRKLPVYGIVVHTTGSGPASSAAENVKTRKGCQRAIDCAISYYVKGSGGFPHYVIDYDGTVYCTCPESHVAWHAGWSKSVREGWRSWSAPEWWSRVWGKDKTPLDLIPSGANSPNTRHIGIEILGPADSVSRDTAEQYRSLARLVVDIDRRHGLGIEKAPSPRLLGHEDVNPLHTDQGGRSNAKGGWDPGAHKVAGSKQRFSWGDLWAQILEARKQPEVGFELFGVTDDARSEFADTGALG